MDSEEELAKLRRWVRDVAEHRLSGQGGRDPRDASDLAQEVLLTYLRRCPEYIRNGTLKVRMAWLRTVLARLFVSGYRRDTRAKHGGGHVESLEATEAASLLADGGPSPESEAELHELAERIEVALAQLSKGQRAVVRMRLWEGGTFTEIAGRLGCSTANVSRIYRSGLKRLEKLLGPLE